MSGIDPGALTTTLGSVFNLDGTGRYIHWGFIQISYANFAVICLLLITFVAALLLPFPHKKGGTK